MEDIWTTRDLPVLEAAVRLLEEQGDRISVKDLADATGLDNEMVNKSLIALEGEYIDEVTKLDRFGSPHFLYVRHVTAAARRAVGQWPTGESLIDQLAAGIARAAEKEADPEQRRRLTSV
jgi:hypothetical protein